MLLWDLLVRTLVALIILALLVAAATGLAIGVVLLLRAVLGS